MSLVELLYQNSSVTFSFYCLRLVLRHSVALYQAQTQRIEYVILANITPCPVEVYLCPSTLHMQSNTPKKSTRVLSQLRRQRGTGTGFSLLGNCVVDFTGVRVSIGAGTGQTISWLLIASVKVSQQANVMADQIELQP